MVTNLSFFSFPYFSYVNLTNNCNLRCLHCLGAYTEKLDKELNLEEWKNVFKELAKEKCFYVNISGGEPTTHPDFIEIMNYLSEIGLHFILTTNGVFSKNIKKAIIDNKEYLIGLKISLDGYDKETHCHLRRDASGNINPEIYDITIKNIMDFKEEKIPLTIATVLHYKNITHFDKFMDKIKEIDPVSWFISPIMPSGRAEYNDFIKRGYRIYEKSFWEDLNKQCKEKRINVKFIEMPFDMQGDKVLDYYECGAGLSFCEINSDGLVSPCTLSRIYIPENKIKFENTRNKTLKDIWNGKIFDEFRRYMTKGCSGCKAFDKCTKCVAQSFKYFGRGDCPTPYCLSNPNIGLKDAEKYKKEMKWE